MDVRRLGGLHGTYLIGERLLGRWLPGGPWRATTAVRLGAAALTFVLVCVAWVFFRATSFGQAFAILQGMVGLGGGEGAAVFTAVNLVLVGVTMGAILAIHGAMRGRSLEDVVGRTPWPIRSAALGAMIVAIVLMQGQDRAFIYFQF